MPQEPKTVSKSPKVVYKWVPKTKRLHDKNSRVAQKPSLPVKHTPKQRWVPKTLLQSQGYGMGNGQIWVPIAKAKQAVHKPSKQQEIPFFVNNATSRSNVQMTLSDTRTKHVKFAHCWVPKKPLCTSSNVVPKPVAIMPSVTQNEVQSSSDFVPLEQDLAFHSLTIPKRAQRLQNLLFHKSVDNMAS